MRACTLLIICLITTAGTAHAQVVIDGQRHHLGAPGRPEWDEFAEDEPEGRALELRFDGVHNDVESTLLIRQGDVKLDWDVRLNGRSLGRLLTMEQALVHTLPVPARTLRDGPNSLTIAPASKADDDIVVDELILDPRPRREALGRSAIDVRVTDAETGRGLPCRLTIVDRHGGLAPLVVDAGSRLAARPGVVYTPDGSAKIGLPPGGYIVYATRGFEYGADRRTVVLAEGRTERVDLAIRREVPTPGLVACDTHVHTLTHSGHGDATIDERAVTLAGEGIELPIVTDHDHFTDLGPAAGHMGVRAAFTPVIGDEVTTRAGHFNAFPMTPGAPVPDSHLTDWPQLLRAIRSAPGGPVVVLNHPRDVHAGFRPFDRPQFHPATGEHARGPLGVDAIEVVNSGAMQSDPLRPIRDWMAVIARGERITAVAASDSHDVARYIVGQGRTYIACPDDDPGRIDIATACTSLKAGRAAVSLGLLARMTVGDRFGEGDLAAGLGETIRVTIAVLGPSWTTADRVALYADGVLIREAGIDGGVVAGEKARVVWDLPRPRHDTFLVAVATGPGVTAPYWMIPRPYQPTSKAWTPRVLGLTNPVFLDGDGDGKWTSPRGSAEALIARVGTDPTKLLPALADYDEAVSTQAAGLCRTAGRDVRGPEFTSALARAATPVRRGFAAFARGLEMP